MKRPVRVSYPVCCQTPKSPLAVFCKEVGLIYALALTVPDVILETGALLVFGYVFIRLLVLGHAVLGKRLRDIGLLPMARWCLFIPRPLQSQYNVGRR